MPGREEATLTRSSISLRQAMEFSISTNGPVSPKKKSSFRSKLGASFENIREGLKTAKDISARNLMEKMESDDSCSSESIIEEVVDLEDDSSSADNEIEEIVEFSSDDDSVLEPLPPPITIPKELQVKDDNESVGKCSSDSDSSDSEEEAKVESKICVESDDESQPPIPLSQRPGTTRGTSFQVEIATSQVTTKSESKPLQSTVEEIDESEKEELHVPLSPKAEGRSDHVGKAKTMSPTQAHGKNEPSKVSSPRQVRQSTPSVEGPPVAGARDDERRGKIEWEKPEWAKKKILRDTSKGHKVLAGEDLSRPIGGIRPINDQK